MMRDLRASAMSVVAVAEFYRPWLRLRAYQCEGDESQWRPGRKLSTRLKARILNGVLSHRREGACARPGGGVCRNTLGRAALLISPQQ